MASHMDAAATAAAEWLTIDKGMVCRVVRNSSAMPFPEGTTPAMLIRWRGECAAMWKSIHIGHCAVGCVGICLRIDHWVGVKMQLK